MFHRKSATFFCLSEKLSFITCVEASLYEALTIEIAYPPNGFYFCFAFQHILWTFLFYTCDLALSVLLNRERSYHWIKKTVFYFKWAFKTSNAFSVNYYFTLAPLLFSIGACALYSYFRACSLATLSAFYQEWYTKSKPFKKVYFLVNVSLQNRVFLTLFTYL